MENKAEELTPEQLVRELEDDLDRFPLPICFDPSEEQRELWGRHMWIERVVERYFRYLSYLKSKDSLTR